MQSQIVRAVPHSTGAPDRYFDLSGMAWKAQTAFRDELVAQGFWVQNVWLEDPILVQVAAELRARHNDDEDGA